MTFDALICSLLAGDIFVAGVFGASIAKTVATCDAVKQLQQRSFMIRVGAVYGTDIHTESRMRVEIVGNLYPCMTDICTLRSD